jgi:pyruvate dehydrogenase E2 component (dihydrolipoamide acetyltransferase)
MSMDVRLPRLGEGADSGTIASLFVKEGDLVKKDQALLELESEKAVATIPSPAGGRVAKVFVKEGDEIKVGHLLFSLAEEGAAPAAGMAPVVDATVGDEAEERLVAPPPSIGPPSFPPAPPAAPVEVLEEPPVRSGPVAAAPSVRKVARELGIDLTRIHGTERGGRIVMEDVRRYIQRLQQIASRPQQAAVAGQAVPPAAAVETLDFSRWGKVSTRKMSTLRRTISGRMVSSWTTIPHITQFDEADITTILALRKKYGAAYEKKKAHLTLTAFALKAVVAVLKKYPIFNSSIDETIGAVVTKEYHHIGIAVDTEQGLIVPVIRDVDAKTLLQVAKDLGDIAERARQRTVGLEEMRGGSFTISNQGGIGSGHFTPIVNKPEVAILGIGRGVLKPVVRGARIEKRVMLPLSLSYDHRIIDGADAARFMVDLVSGFESFKDGDVKL